MPLRTPLWETHHALDATFTEFSGYDMPVHYGSIKEEHVRVREQVGLFDVSHMSNVWVTGPDAAALLSRVTPSDAAAVPVGRGKYSVLLREDGTILDDLFYFRMEEERYFLVPNAGMNEASVAHLREHKQDLAAADGGVGGAEGEGDPDVHVGDATSDWAILALQGPYARATLEDAATGDPPRFHHIVEMQVAGASCLVSGTGYTGEKGVELFVPARQSTAVWNALMAAGAVHGIGAVGLGARDTLRLEKGYCLAGHEFEGGRTPLEAGLGWLVDWEVDFLGKGPLAAQKEAGEHDMLVGLVLERGIPRQGYRILRDGAPVGIVTSGTQSPTLGKGIALGYVKAGLQGDQVDVEIRDRALPATVVKPPFV